MKQFSIVVSHNEEMEDIEIIKEIKSFLKEKYQKEVFVKNIFLKNK